LAQKTAVNDINIAAGLLNTLASRQKKKTRFHNKLGCPEAKVLNV
jgi:hypothetical protein